MAVSVASGAELTLGVMRDAKAVVKELDVARNTAVKASWGEPLDEMEALAYLLGDAMGHILLPDRGSAEAWAGGRTTVEGCQGSVREAALQCCCASIKGYKGRSKRSRKGCRA